MTCADKIHRTDKKRCCVQFNWQKNSLAVAQPQCSWLYSSATQIKAIDLFNISLFHLECDSVRLHMFLVAVVWFWLARTQRWLLKFAYFECDCTIAASVQTSARTHTHPISPTPRIIFFKRSILIVDLVRYCIASTYLYHTKLIITKVVYVTYTMITYAYIGPITDHRSQLHGSAHTPTPPNEQTQKRAEEKENKSN